jgi:glutathione peroxidase
MRATCVVAVPVLLSLAAPFAAGGPVSPDSFYALKTTTLSGQPAELSQYQGKVALVVNVASQCGLTPQYAGLQKLYDELQGKGFVVLGFPSNDFGGQEPGTPQEIEGFCRKNYGVTFPMFSKLVTKAGPEQSPIYAHLGRTGSLPTWNFAKYVVDKQGNVVQFFNSKVAPDDAELRKTIEAELAK